MRIRKNFLLEKLGVTSAVTAMSMATASATDDKTKPSYADKEIKKMVIEDEGVRTAKYLDTKGIPTVGIGHNLGEEKASIEAFKRAFGSEGESLRNAVMSGSRLTKEQAEKLFDVDYEEHRNRTVKMIPNLDTYDPEVQSVLVSGTYRGHVSDSPTFRKLLAAGKYEEAATELLNREEYKNPKKDKKGNLIAPGVITRLERDADIIRRMGQKKTSVTPPSDDTVAPQDTVTTPQKTVTTPQKPVTTGRVHTVIPGDNLSKIAAKYKKTLQQILDANPGIKNPDRIDPKQNINIPD